jgi:hypothetical protein
MSETRPTPVRAPGRADAPNELDHLGSEASPRQGPTRDEDGAARSGSRRGFSRRIDCSPGAAPAADQRRGRHW